MIKGKTFLQGHDVIELRVYTKWFRLSDVFRVWDEVKQELTTTLPSATSDDVVVCSNRAGLHFAFTVRAPIANRDAALAKLKQLGWKEAKK
jgi:hypothetical protein